MTLIARRTALGAAVAIAALGASSSPAAAALGKPDVAGLQCRVELPVRVDDRGVMRPAGHGTSDCNGRLDGYTYAGTHGASFERLTVMPAAGGGWAIRTARIKAYAPSLEGPFMRPVPQIFRMQLQGAAHLDTATAQTLRGTATDKDDRPLTAAGTVARVKGVCVQQRRKQLCGVVVPTQLVFNVSLTGSTLPADGVAGLL